MASVLDAVSETMGAWLTREERALARLLGRRHEPAVAERLRIWEERLRAYERVEAARDAARARSVELSCPRPPIPPAVEHGLRLVS
jgi:hypothetical protein